ncbi:MAG: hypothetical protein ABGW63_04115 [Flavobacteriaceae bacterium]
MNCQKPDNRCGIIIQKTIIDDNFYFVLQTDEYINYYNNPNQPNLPDNGVRQGKVSEEIYDNFEEGSEYCSEV